ncbi:hypothetical protein [Hymenobacter sediminicola]|uniref:PorT family protein n=1 Tax=Hymenobacter sediminicola TaxID=2761579 RepID=A0A7G7WAG7_9BACT|nr:hypothetical protein [Hymenobacter sediminicola]QNH63360.1 hypothetical protein H4317_06035 [Hymenobacter sediminicola]
MKNILIVLVAIGSGVVKCHAQILNKKNKSNDTPKCYVGINASNNRYEAFYRGSASAWPSTTLLRPWSASFGLAINSRLETGGHYMAQNEESKSESEGVNGNGLSISTKLYDKRQSWVLPLMVRYSLYRKSKGRFNIDILGGITLLSDRFVAELTRTEGPEVIAYRYNEGKGLNIYASTGVGARYLFGKRLEVVGDISFSRVLKNVEPDVHRLLLGNSTGLTRSNSIGLRYRFNFKIDKPAPKEDAME